MSVMVDGSCSVAPSSPPATGSSVQTHSRLFLRRPCMGVEGASSTASVSSTALPFVVIDKDGFSPRLRFDLPSLESEDSDSDSDASTTGVGATSARLSRNSTLLTGGNIRRGGREVVALSVRCRLGSGLFLRIERAVCGRV